MNGSVSPVVLERDRGNVKDLTLHLTRQALP